MNTPRSDRRLTSWLSLVIALAFVAVTVFGVITYRNTVVVREGEALVAHSHQVRELTRDLLASIKDMETGQRGFLITGELAYLAPYDAALERVQNEFTQLQVLIAGNPPQRDRLERLRLLDAARRAELAETIELRSKAGPAGFDMARQIILAGRGKVLMDEMRGVVRELLDEEQRLLDDWDRAATARVTMSKRLIVVGNATTLALLVLSGVVAHIDRRKRDAAEADLQFGQAELGAIFDSAADGIVTFNQDLRIRLMNPAAAKMHRCDALSALGRPLLDFVPARLRDLVRNDIGDFLRSDERTREFAKGVALREDGSEFPCDGSLAKSAMVAGEQFVTLLFRDLSEALARDAKIRELSEILNHVRDAIVVCDLDDCIIFWNQGAKSLFGYSTEQALGQNAVELVFGNQRELWNTGRETMLTQRVFSTEISQLDQAGRDLVVEHRRSLITDAAGKPTAQLILHLDITARKQEEAHQRRAQRLESIGTLAGGIAHDLNNVLTPILMSSKLLKRSGDNRERLLDMIVTSAQRGGNMIKKLLAFAGGEQGSRDRIDVPEIISESEEILRHTLPKTIELRVACGEHLHAVMGNATELSQVLMNLAINARDAMPNGGRLELRAENFQVESSRVGSSQNLTAGPHVLIRVSDTGSGISKANLDRIFDPFFTTKELGQGTGLGLSISLGIVHGHGGDMTVTSRLGHGTTFSIYLPAAKLEESPLFREAACELPSGNGERILLVDDEPLIVEAARVTLEASGYRIAAAGSGAEAVDYYQQHSASVDAVLLDMMMPDMDGFAAKDRLRAINAHVPIIASSGLHRPSAAERRLADMDGFLPKPYSDEQLLRVVRMVLDGARKG